MAAMTVHNLVIGEAASGSVVAEGPTPPPSTTTETQGVGSAGGSPPAEGPTPPPSTTETQGVGSAGGSPSSKSQQCTCAKQAPLDTLVLVSGTCLQVGYPCLTCFFFVFLTVQDVMQMLQDMKKMFEIQFKARHEVESALFALVEDLEPISDLSRIVERLLIEVDEAKVIRNPNPLMD